MKSHLSSPVVLRISLVTAIVTSLAAAGGNYFRVRQKIAAMRAELAAQTTIAQRAESELQFARTELEKTTIRLKAVQLELEQTEADKKAELATMAEKTGAAEKCCKEVSDARRDLEDAQRYLSRYRAAGLEPEQIVVAAKQIADLRKAVAAAETRNLVLEQKQKLVTKVSPDVEATVALPAALRGRVISTDPKWRFLVLDVGADQGVLENGEVLLRRGDKLLGRARVSRVQQDCCVANVMSGWELGEIQEGDIAIPATPHS